MVQRGHDIRFWHLTFQEYLTAKAVGALTEKPQQELLLREGKLYQPEWREAVLLLGGVLHSQGKEKVDGLISAALDGLGKRPSLVEQARFAGVFGAMMNDLSPFGFRPSDSRYEKMLDKVMGIFDREKSKSVPVEDRIAAAEALGQAGDPRLTPVQYRRNWVEISGGSFPPLFPGPACGP